MNLKLPVAFFILLLISIPAMANKADKLHTGEMGENVTSAFGDLDIERRATFDDKSQEIVWFAAFKGFMTAYKANLTAEWISPSGEIFKTQKFSTIDDNCRFGWVKLDVGGEDKKALEQKGEWTVKIYWDEELIDTDKFSVTVAPPTPVTEPKNVTVRVLEGDLIVYEGPEQADDSIWKSEKKDFASLAIQGPAGSSKKIAIIAYPYELDIVTGSLGFDRGKYVARELKNKGLKLRKVYMLPNRQDQYNYSLIYDTGSKKISTQFDAQSIYMPGQISGVFPRDLSASIAQRAVTHYLKAGYSVLDLTASREELEGKTVSEITNLVHDKHGIDRVLFIPNGARTQWTWNLGNGTRTEIGLLLCYAGIIFDHGKADPSFTFSDNVDLGENEKVWIGTPTKKNLPGRKINFYSEEMSKGRNPVRILKDGYFDDVWAASIVLSKFSGYALYDAQRQATVQTLGPLFNKLEEGGFLSELATGNLNAIDAPQGNSFVSKRADLTDENGQVILRLMPCVSVEAKAAEGDKTPVEISAKFKQRDVEEKTDTLIRLKNSVPRFAWPASLIKPTYYYYSVGKIVKKELILGKDVSIVSEDGIFLSVKLKGFIATQDLEVDAEKIKKVGRIVGTLISDAGPAAGVLVGAGNEAGVKTDAQGKYVFENLTPGMEYRLRIKRGTEKRPEWYISLPNFPVLAPGEELVYPPVNIDALKNSSPDKLVAIFSDGYVTEQEGVTAFLPKFIISAPATDRLLDGKMEIMPVDSLEGGLGGDLSGDLKKFGITRKQY